MLVEMHHPSCKMYAPWICSCKSRSTRSRRPPLILQHPPPPLRTPTPLQRSNQLKHLLELLTPARLRTTVMVEMVDKHARRYYAAMCHHKVADHLEHATTAKGLWCGC